MDYRAVLTLDYTKPIDRNAYTRLLNALVQAGWSYAETSALYVDSDDLAPIQLALEVLARATHTPGTLSALTIQVQLVGHERPAPAAVNHAKALTNLLQQPLPSDDSN